MKTEAERKVLNSVDSDMFDLIGMTKIQERRAKMLLKGMSKKEIASDEGVDSGGVESSIEGAMIKVRKTNRKLMVYMI